MAKRAADSGDRRSKRKRPALRDQESRNALVIKNMGLVYSIVQRRYSQLGEAMMDDLIQVGMLGLLRAAELFDESRKIRFSTYATHHILETIWHYRICDRTVRIPRHANVKLAREDAIPDVLYLNLHEYEDGWPQVASWDQDVDRQESLEELHWLVKNAKMSKLCRDTIKLFLRGKTFRQIAKVQGVCYQAVSLRWYRIVGMLRGLALKRLES